MGVKIAPTRYKKTLIAQGFILWKLSVYEFFVLLGR